MSTKEDVLNVLKDHKDEYYSGQQLAEMLGVSRTAIWKAINTLRRQGYNIVGSTKKGYAFNNDSNILNVDYIFNRLSPEAQKFYDINVIRVCPSTNDMIKDKAAEGAKEGTVIIAEEQTAGKGRRGRSFLSPVATGVYLSILLRPDVDMQGAVLITTAAAVAAVRSMKTFVPEDEIGIKWVNDIFKDGKKVAGILTEASLDIETRKINAAVMGLGVNYADPLEGWSDDLKGIAGSLYGKEVPPEARNDGIVRFLEEFYKVYKELPKVTYLEDYRKYSIVIDRDIKVINPGHKPVNAHAVDIDDQCHLIVRYKDGREETLDSGEISIRL